MEGKGGKNGKGMYGMGIGISREQGERPNSLFYRSDSRYVDKQGNYLCIRVENKSLHFKLIPSL